jgi:hypothetical protein
MWGSKESLAYYIPYRSLGIYYIFRGPLYVASIYIKNYLALSIRIEVVLLLEKYFYFIVFRNIVIR